MDLIDGLRLGSSPRLALVGAGGKTALLFSIARAYHARGQSSLLTTTTHLATLQVKLADDHFVIQSPHQFQALRREIPSGVILLTGGPAEQDRVAGLDSESLALMLSLANDRELPLLIEADGARQRAVKAPADHEPVIPEFIGIVVLMADLIAVEKPLTEKWVHRPEQFAELSDLKLGEKITTTALAKVMSSPLGGCKAIPPGARRLVFFSRADTPVRWAAGTELADMLTPHFDGIAIGRLGNHATGAEDVSEGYWRPAATIHAMHEPIVGVVLAGGASTRFREKPKQTLLWNGEPMVRVVARKALEAGLQSVTVVTGAHADSVGAALSGLPVAVVHNKEWKLGQSTSVRAGLGSLPDKTGGALFLLADQPQIPINLMETLVNTHRKSLASIIAPEVAGRRGNPVLFDRRTFSALLALQGDVGGRSLFSNYPVVSVPWDDPNILLDIDTVSDLMELQRRLQH